MRRFLSVLFMLSLGHAAAATAGTVIGAFSDYGNSCSFSGNNAGLLTVHVIVRPDPVGGVRAVRFTAPAPPCMGATWVGDIVPDGIVAIGDSQTGISLSAPACEEEALHVLDIVYQTSGTTTACCPFEIKPEPGFGLEAVDCSFQTAPMTSMTSHFNADSTCTCQAGSPPPGPPANPVPADGTQVQTLDLTMSWTCTDPNGLDVACDLYMGTSANAPLVARNITGAGSYSYNTPHLAPNAIYYWRVVGHNQGGGATSGPLWRFATGPNYPPFVTLTEPANGALDVASNPTLKWTASGIGPFTYDVYFGASPNPPMVASPWATAQYAPGTLAYNTTYWWRVVAHDARGIDGSSATWSFTTRASNLPPNAPIATSPLDNATNVSPTPWDLFWQGTDPDGQLLSFDIYFGTASDPPLVFSGASGPPYGGAPLEVATTYYWRIVATDPLGATTSGPIWSFRTRNNTPPPEPSSPAPHDGTTGHPVTTTLKWTCTDADGQPLVFDVYWGTTSPPPLIASNVAAKFYYPGTQQYLTKYYWRIVAHDTKGAETTGATWSYTTRSEDRPPTAPTNPQPTDGATGQPVNVKLGWQASDPDNDVLNFDVYFGTSASPPLVANHIASMTYDPGPLAISTMYNWRIVARDPSGQETSGAVWSFTTAATSSRPPTLPSSPQPPDGSTNASKTPFLAWSSTDPDGDPLHYTVFVFIDGPIPFSAETDNPYYQLGLSLVPGRSYSWFVTVTDGHWTVTGPTWLFMVGGGQLPVAFQSFAATPSGVAVQVRWELSSDETMESYTLYRRDDSGAVPLTIAQGRVDRSDGSYLDTSVAPGRTYRYELMVRTPGGDEFRSPVASVSMAALSLTLHQNTPNPFNPQTTIAYDLPSASRVRLLVMDVSGKLVRTLVDETQSSGSRSAIWNGRDDGGSAVSSGVYFYVLDAGKERLTRKLVLLK